MSVAADRPPSVDLPLRTGGLVRVRLATAGDEPELLAGFDALSAESRYFRFFSPMPRLSGRLLEELQRFDLGDHLAIPAFDPATPSPTGNPDGLGVGIVRVIRSTEAETEAEFAVTVIDAYQQQGIGWILLEAATVVAHRLGVRRLTGVILAENHRMLDLALAVGFHPEPGQDEPDVRIVAATTDELLDRIPAERRRALATLLGG